MSEKESYQAARESEHDIVLHPERELPHLGVIGQLVGAMMYQGSHHGDHDGQARDDGDEAHDSATAR